MLRSCSTKSLTVKCHICIKRNFFWIFLKHVLFFFISLFIFQFFFPLNAATQVDYVETELKKITSNAAVLLPCW